MNKSIGKILKESRISSGTSVKEISDLLVNKGYKASESTIYSWENENSQPTPGAFLVMCDAYGIKNVLTTFGYNGYNKDGSLQLNMKEVDIVEKYRDLDPHGKEMVDFTLQKEWERSTAKHASENKAISVAIQEETPDYLKPQAAHNDHESEPDEQKKMREDLSNLKIPD